jgi:hypothetical protein
MLEQARSYESDISPELYQALYGSPNSRVPEGEVKEEGWGGTLLGWIGEKYTAGKEVAKRWGRDAGEALLGNLIQPEESDPYVEKQLAALDYNPRVNLAERLDETATDIGGKGGELGAELAYDAAVSKGVSIGAGGVVGSLGKGKRALKNLAREADEVVEAEAKAAKRATSATKASTPKSSGGFVKKRESMSAEAQAYEEAVAGSRPGEAYRLPYKNPKPRGRPHVDFDGVQRGAPVDAKLSIVTRQKTVDQATRQAEALRQNGLRGVWKVPSLAEARRAQRMLQRADATDTIFVIVER